MLRPDVAGRHLPVHAPADGDLALARGAALAAASTPRYEASTVGMMSSGDTAADITQMAAAGYMARWAIAPCPTRTTPTCWPTRHRDRGPSRGAGQAFPARRQRHCRRSSWPGRAIFLGRRHPADRRPAPLNLPERPSRPASGTGARPGQGARAPPAARNDSGLVPVVQDARSSPGGAPHLNPHAPPAAGRARPAPAPRRPPWLWRHPPAPAPSGSGTCCADRRWFHRDPADLSSRRSDSSRRQHPADRNRRRPIRLLAHVPVDAAPDVHSAPPTYTAREPAVVSDVDASGHHVPDVSRPTPPRHHRRR